MSSTMETHILDMDEPSEPRKPMDWREVARHHFELRAAGCRWKTIHGWCRPSEARCSMETCEFVRRYGR